MYTDNADLMIVLLSFL